MNRILKVVFSRAKGMFVVVSELGRACSKSGVKSVLVTMPLVLASTGAMAADNVEEYFSINASDTVRTDVEVTTSAEALGGHSLALGELSSAEDKYSVALGYKSSAADSGSIALGTQSSAAGPGAIAIGSTWSYYIDETTTSVGLAPEATGVASIAIGSESSAAGDYSVALGLYSSAEGSSSVALGKYSSAEGLVSVALGYDSSAEAEFSAALGSFSSAKGRYSVALGHYSKATDPLTVSLGDGTKQYRDIDGDGQYEEGYLYRRIVNMADGTAAHDAATVGQVSVGLNALQGILGDDITYTDTDPNNPEIKGVFSYTATNIGGTGATTISEAIRLAAQSGSVNWDAIKTETGTAASDAIQAQAKAAVKVVAASNSPVTVTADNGTYTVDVASDGQVASGDTGLVTGGTVYTALNQVSGAIDAVNNYLSINPTADGRPDSYVATSAKALGKYSVAIGDNAKSKGSSSIAIGSSSNASQNYAVAVGVGSSAVFKSVALGSESVANTSNTVSVGHLATDIKDSTTGDTFGSDLYRRIVNVADGTADHDAATVGQLKTEVRLEEDGNYTLATNTAALNIAALDAKLYAALSTASGIDVAKWSETLGTGTVTNGNEGLVTGGAVYEAIQNINTVVSSGAQANASNVGAYATEWGQALGTGAVQAGDGKLVTGDTVNTAINSAVANKLDKDLTSLSDTGRKEVASIAQSAVTVGNGKHTEVKVETDQTTGSITYKVDVKTDGVVAEGDTGIVTGGAVYDAIQKVTSDTTLALDNKLDKSTFEDYQAKNDQAVTNATNVANDASTKADAATTVANNALAEAEKHTSVTSSNQSVTIVESTNAQGGKNYDLSVSFDSLGSVSSGQGDKQIVMNGDEGTLKVGDTLTLDSTGKITGVAAGEISATSKDAVNGSQLYETQQMIGQNASNIQTLSNQVNKTYDKVQRVGAGAAALAALRPQDFSPEHPISGAVGLGHYDGKQAIAVGMYYRPTENLTVGFGASAAGSDDYMMNAGISYRFGGSGSQLRLSQSDINRKVVDLTDQNRALVAQIESSNIREEASAKRLNQVTKQLASTQTTLTSTQTALKSTQSELKSAQSELKSAQKKAALSDQKLDMVMKELAVLRNEIQKMKQK